jgi:nonsense-mediated mRNA decay protein 3
VTILWCKECGRYLQPPKHWVRAEPESKELLTFCTKRIKGLQVGLDEGTYGGIEGAWGF